ncbi:MAG TPA: phage tail sheath C-terminal domain-containing protein [Candidatus Acidoferrales bacterium]|nr:phage tail sheath C-terminal domain-containing protein [Candidatus Acidoferrales bacterium]
MPVTPTYPGVYIEEIPSGVHPITGVATSIGAFIDFFSRGPCGLASGVARNYAVHILSMADFERIFGGLTANSEASYAIQQFFLNGGTEAYVVRVTDSTAAAAAITLDDKPGGAGIVKVTAGQMVGQDLANNPGAWGKNLRVEVDYNTTDPANLFNMTFTEVDPESGHVLQSETYRNLTMTSGTPNYAVDVVNQASKMVYLTSAGAGRPAATGTLGGSLPLVPVIPATAATFHVDPGSGAKLATLSYGGAAPSDYPSLRPFLEAAIRAANPADPLLVGASVQLIGSGTSASHYQFLALAGRAGANFDPSTILKFSDVGSDTVAGAVKLDAANAVDNVQQYSVGTGTAGAQSGAVPGADGSVPGTNPANTIIGVQANKTGIYALEDADLFNILCIPVAATLSQASDTQAVYAAATAYCDYRRAFLILDIPSAVKDVAGMQTWMTQNDTLRDANAAVYFPRVRIPDPLSNNRLRDLAPSGTIAGLYALTDVNRGVWKAPAGTETQLRNVSQLVYNLTDGENGVLNPLGINCLRNFPVYGNICWGARTLDGADVQASDWKYIPIRRLALFLEESLYRGTKWVVFEPNDEPLWAQIRLNVGAFMQSLFRQGAFQGSTPQQAYLVKCDSETTTPDDQAKGIVNIVVGFAPLKPAEFVIIQIQQLAGQTPA